ncbi:MAG: DUF2975 domain-containing protein, partial [Oscillospiraceae bacterium]|nr:DUF2975 domain-containing protein [Candidatus Equicaccousia limihippi]
GFAGFYPIWAVLTVLTAIPCAIGLFFGWKVAANIGADRSFSYENASLLKKIANLAIIDAAYYFIVNIIMLVANVTVLGLLALSLMAVFAGVAVAVAAAALSHLVQKAAALQEQSDLTI